MLFAFAASSRAAAAQDGGANIQPHVRADALLAREAAGHLAAGLSVRAARYLRVDATVGGGVIEDPAGGSDGEVRGDVVARFVLDPDFARRVSAYGGGGVSVRGARGDTRELLLVALGVEGPRWGGVVPFAEVGFGGGVRLGFGMRRALRGRR